MLKYLLVSLGLTLIFTPILIYFTFRFRLFDHPGERRINSHSVPTAGGLAIYLAFFITACFQGAEHLVPYFVGGTIIIITGLIDDYKGLSAGMKFFGQVAAVAAFLWMNPSPNYLIAALWMLSVINIINFIDGLDGLANGIILIASIALFTWIYGTSYQDTASLLLTFIGANIGFLVFNFNPAKIFLGDTGAMLIGLLFAALANNSVLTGDIMFSLPLLVLILAVPTTDTFCAIVRRLQQGVPIYQADKQHFHHRLLELGLNQRQVALCGYMLTLVSSATALLLVKNNSWNQFIILPVIAVVLVYGAGRIGMVKPLVVKSQRRVL